MRSTIIAAALAGAASASWAPQGPPAYGPGSWGESSAAPVTSEAPVYSAPTSVTSEAPVYTTDIVTAYTTYCPEATEITHGGVTYTATEATTLTICPGDCTVTKPVSSTPAPPVYPTTSVSPVAPVPYPSGNTTIPTFSTAAPIGTTATTSYASTGSPIASAPPSTGAAAKSYSAVGAIAVAVFGLVASL